MSVEEAAALVRPRDAIGFGIITGTPVALFRALGARRDWEDLTFSGGLSLGSPDIFLHPNVHYRVNFFGGNERALIAKGADVQHVPSFFRHYGILIQHLKPRVMMAPVSMPDENGRVSLSLYNGATLDELVRAGRDPERLLIVEASPHFPLTRALVGHENHLDLEDIDVIVYTDEEPTTFANDPGSPEDSKIAEFAARYIPDGATLQTGIGAVPNLVARALARGDGGEYGVHSEMFTDGLFELMAAGKATNTKKTINRGTAVITFAAGTRAMYDFMDDNPDIGVAPVFYTNDPHVIAQNHRMVSINSALEVDLQGQIMADTIGARQFSGVGGHGLHRRYEPLARARVAHLSPIDGHGRRRSEEPYHWRHDPAFDSDFATPGGRSHRHRIRIGRPARTDGERTRRRPHGSRSSAVPRRTHCSG